MILHSGHIGIFFKWVTHDFDQKLKIYSFCYFEQNRPRNIVGSLWSKSVGQPVSQSVSLQPVRQSVIQPISQSVSQPVSQSTNQSVSQSVRQYVCQSGSLILSQSVSDAGCISDNVDCMSDLTHSQFYNISSSSMWKSWELWTKF